MRPLFAGFSVTLMIFASVAIAQPAQRPPITGLSHVCVYASDPAKTGDFFVSIIGLSKASDPENPSGQRYYINPTQFVEVLPLPAGKPATSLDHVAYVTTNLRAMRAYLAAHGVATPAKLEIGRDGSRWFRVKDPEGNVVEFVQNPSHFPSPPATNQIGHHMIHAGFLVYSRANEDKFYRDLLGFRPYWFGGPKEGEIAWVSQQVPDGTDWLEYMLTTHGKPPATASGLGVLDHFSIGVKDMAATAALLKSTNRLDSNQGHPPAVPKIGRDGKWQLNLYDPDGTRIELMEFNNVQPPCCSPFTASNPKPQ